METSGRNTVGGVAAGKELINRRGSKLIHMNEKRWISSSQLRWSHPVCPRDELKQICRINFLPLITRTRTCLQPYRMSLLLWTKFLLFIYLLKFRWKAIDSATNLPWTIQSMCDYNNQKSGWAVSLVLQQRNGHKLQGNQKVRVKNTWLFN